MKLVTRCMKCHKDISKETKYYLKGKVYCVDCNQKV